MLAILTGIMRLVLGQVIVSLRLVSTISFWEKPKILMKDRNHTRIGIRKELEFIIRIISKVKST